MRAMHTSTRSSALPIALALCLPLAACSDDGDTGQPDGTTDAGPDMTADVPADGGGGDAPSGDATGDDGTAEVADDTMGNDTMGDAGPATAAITAEDQSLDDATEVVVAEATLEAAGWIVIHQEAAGGAPGDVIGHAALDAGTSTDVGVGLDRAAVDGETLIAMLHEDTGEMGTYEFGDVEGADPPVTDADGNVVLDPFTVTVDQTADAVVAEAQTLEDLSTTVTVEHVASTEPGWMVVHEASAEGADVPFGAVIGHAQVSEGVTSDVTVALDRPAEDGETLYAMLHRDTGEMGTYEFGDVEGADPPVTDAEGDIVLDGFDVSVASGTPAVRFVLGANGSDDYTFDEVHPSRHADMVGETADDDTPDTGDNTLQLRQGWRYAFQNENPDFHPLAFITRGENRDDDTILLAHGDNDGSFEGEQPVNFQDGETMRFTLAPDLAAELDGYECQTHSPMVGDVMVMGTSSP